VNTYLRRTLHETLQAPLTTLRRVVSFPHALPVLAIALLPAGLSAQITLNLVQPLSTELAASSGDARQIAADAAGNVYITHASEIIKITPSGKQAVIASGLDSSGGVAVDGAGNVYATEDQKIVKISPSGTQTTLSFQQGGVNFEEADLLAVDGSGNVYITDSVAHQVDVISAGYMSVVMKNVAPTGIAVDSMSNIIYVSEQNENQVFRTQLGQGVQNFVNANGPTGLAVDGNGNLFIQTSDNSVVEAPISNAGQPFTVLSGISSNAIAADNAGNLFLPGNANQLLKASLRTVPFASQSVCQNMTCGETMTLTYAATGSGSVAGALALSEGANLSGVDFSVVGNTCTSVTTGSTCTINVKFSPRLAGLRTGALQIVRPNGTLAAQTDLYGIAEGPQVAFDGAAVKQVVAGLDPNAVTVDGAGDIFFVTNNNVKEVPARESVQFLMYSGLSAGSAVAIDSAGNIYAGDAGNNDVLEITPAGSVGTLATGVCPSGLTVDPSGDVYIADSCHNQVVEVLGVTGNHISWGTGLNGPTGVALDSTGNLFIADTGNQRVVEIPAGGGTQTTVDGSLPSLGGVAVDAAGNLLAVSDGEAVEIPAAGAPPIVLAAQVGQAGIAVDGAGDLFFAETANSQIAEVIRSQAPTMTFPATAVNAASVESITMENIGNQALTAVSPGLTSATPYYQPLSGSSDCTSTFSLEPATSCNLAIEFTPNTTGAIPGQLSISDNSLNSPNAVQQIPFTGTGVE
jgi:sugar lactone lactonase YvrE